MGTSQGKPLCWELKLPPASELLQAVSDFGVFLPHLTEVARWLSQPREEGPSQGVAVLRDNVCDPSAL